MRTLLRVIAALAVATIAVLVARRRTTSAGSATTGFARVSQSVWPQVPPATSREA